MIYFDKLKLYKGSVFFTDRMVPCRDFEEAIMECNRKIYIINPSVSNINPMCDSLSRAAMWPNIKIKDMINLNEYAFSRIIYLDRKKSRIEMECFQLDIDGASMSNDFNFDYRFLYGSTNLEYGDNVRKKYTKNTFTLIAPPKMIGDNKIASSRNEYLDFSYKPLNNVYACWLGWDEIYGEYDIYEEGELIKL